MANSLSDWFKLGLAKPSGTDYEEHSAVGDVSTGRRFKAVQDVLVKLYVDEVAPDAFYYIGETKMGTDTAQALWRVRRILITNSVTMIDFADGNDLFDNTWDDRASYLYS